MTLLPRQIAHHAPGPGLQPTRCLCAKARVAPCILSEVWRLQAARLQAAGSRSAYCLSARWGCRTACGPSAQHPTHGAHAKRRRLAARPERVRTSTETISTMMSCTAQRGVRAPPWGQHLQPCHEMVAKHSHSDRGLRCSWACQGAQRLCVRHCSRPLPQRTLGAVAQRKRGRAPRRCAQLAACACRAAGRARRAAQCSARRRTPGVSKGARPHNGEVWHDILLLHCPQTCARLSRPSRAWQSPRDLTAHAQPRCAWCQVTLRAQAALLSRRGGRAVAGAGAPG